MLTMSEYRMYNPKPPLFDLLHKWNLTPEQIKAADFYELDCMSAVKLAAALDKNAGRLYHIESGRLFVPVYMYTSRRDIVDDSHKLAYLDESYRDYLLSYRSVNSTNIVLIQRKKYKVEQHGSKSNGTNGTTNSGEIHTTNS